MGIKDSRKKKSPNTIGYYFSKETRVLIIVSITGILYNIGMTAGPWFEGQMAQLLCDIIQKKREFRDMVLLCGCFILIIAFVQIMRYMKRFYVRRFANDISRDMKLILYDNLIHKSTTSLKQEEVGSVMTKAIQDVDTCAEGMRKFTTEIFDTGIVMISYLIMLFLYDWRLTLLSCLFPPIAFFVAGRLRTEVTKSAALCKESAGKLSGMTYDRVNLALTYRILGAEINRDEAYDEQLKEYKKRAIYAGILQTATKPIYQVISMTGILFILWFGIKNVLGEGWEPWNIAAFTTFLSCFTLLAQKSSKSANLFNAIQKAMVSWHRITPLLRDVPEDKAEKRERVNHLFVQNLTFSYDHEKKILDHISFHAHSGQIIGITGQVACGKSTLGKVFLMEQPYEGSIKIDGVELSDIEAIKRCGLIAYMGHDAELISGSIKENILLGDTKDVMQFLKNVAMDQEVLAMKQGVDTKIGMTGVRLSGGQQARIALARTIAHQKPIVILDDPFAALDQETEAFIMSQLKECLSECIVLLISHRLYQFQQVDQVLWMEGGGVIAIGTHEELFHTNQKYRNLYETQIGGEKDET